MLPDRTCGQHVNTSTREKTMTEIDTTDEELNGETSANRRALLTKAGAAAAVAAVAGLAVSKSAEAADGDPLLIASPNVSTPGSFSSTGLSGGSSLVVFDGTTGAGNQSSIRGEATTNDHSGVRGDATGSAGFGVYGTSTGFNGAGMRGENSGSGGFGVYGLNSSDGTDSAGVFGLNTGDGHGVWGSTVDASSAGVYGIHRFEDGTGVYGRHHNSGGGAVPGIGVLGTAQLGTGVVGRGPSYDVLADSSGKVGLGAVGTTGATATGTIGTIARDADGHLWYCYATNQWEQLSGIVPPGTPPAFTSISPIRAYDSRRAAIPESGTFTANSNKVISIKDGRDGQTGAITEADAIPVGATAIAYNVTATNTTDRSFLSVVPGDVLLSAVSSLNWPGPNISIANAGIVGIDASRQVNVIAGPRGTFDALIDITGYFS
jgi:hypothetical protein